MKLAISQIAWTDEQDDYFLKFIKENGFHHIELVPSRFGNSLAEMTDDEIKNYLAKLSSNELTPISMQGLLFGSKDLHLFNSKKTRESLLEFMYKAIETCSRIGVKNMVFGSPKNRNMPNDLDKKEAMSIAKEFFFKTRSPSQPKNKVPTILNKPIIASDQPAISIESPLEIRSFGRWRPIKVTWKPHVKKPKMSNI